MTLKDLSIKAQIEMRIEVLTEEWKMCKEILEDENATDWEKIYYKEIKAYLGNQIAFNKKRLEAWKED